MTEFNRRCSTRFSVKAFALGVATLLCACTTFHGPGPYIGPTTEISPVDGSPQMPIVSNHAPASVILNGERVTTREESGIAFDWPVDEAKLSRGFLSARSRKKRAHWGVDLANKRGTPILSAERGTVIYTGHAFRGYGKLIVIEHNEEWATLYSHLDKILVKEGQTVKKGETIAQMGRTGRATGVHLHFEVRHYRQPVNPLAFLPQADASGFAAMMHESSIQLTKQATPVSLPAED